MRYIADFDGPCEAAVEELMHPVHPRASCSGAAPELAGSGVAWDAQDGLWAARQSTPGLPHSVLDPADLLDVRKLDVELPRTATASSIGKDVEQLATDSAETERLAVSQGLAACVPDGVLHCYPGLAGLTRASEADAASVAKVLLPHPGVCVEIISYTVRPGGRWDTLEKCVELTIQRAQLVKEALARAGCRNRMVALGLGFCDDGGSRVLVRACSGAEVDQIEAEAALQRLQVSCLVAQGEGTLAARGPAPPPLPAADPQPPALRLVLLDAEGAPRSAIFDRRPLGICFSRTTPAVITEVDPWGQAESLRVQAGWSIKSVDGQDAARLQPALLVRLLASAAAGLPDAPASAAAPCDVVGTPETHERDAPGEAADASPNMTRLADPGPSRGPQAPL